MEPHKQEAPIEPQVPYKHLYQTRKLPAPKDPIPEEPVGHVPVDNKEEAMAAELQQLSISPPKPMKPIV